MWPNSQFPQFFVQCGHLLKMNPLKTLFPIFIGQNHIVGFSFIVKALKFYQKSCNTHL